MLAVPRQHPLAARQTLKLEELAQQRLLLLEDGHCLRDQALDVCHMAGASERDFRATSLETPRQMVAANVGITLLPMLAVQPPVPPSPEVKLLRFRDSTPSRRLALVWRRSSAMSGFLHTLGDVLRALPKHLLVPKAPQAAG
jgi:LysR family hydrogen peroxide-inducible transcriptional activator